VTVDIGSAGSATTDAEGKYAIENLIVDSYTATFSKTGYPAITRTITSNDFVDGVATVNVEMGLAELLRGQTAFDLANANKWYYNDYRGGRNGNGLDNDWALDYLCITDYYGNIQEQNEGVALQTRNGEADQSNPADLNAFDSYIYGSKLITADNKYLTLSVRTHNASQEAPAYFGVQVVDLSAAEPAAVKIGETQERYGENYTEHTFDLSAYVGKEVIVAVGIYRAATGDYWKQLPIRRMIFTSTDSPDITVGPSSDGTEVVTGWKLTQEMVRSTMVNEKNTFTGITSVAGNRDGYYDAYRSWREVSHIADNWAFVRNPKDPEPFASQGYIIKTNATETGATIPQSYLYAKFAIAAGKNTLTLKGRTMSSGSRPVRYTYFKLIVMDEAAPGTPIAIAPTPGGTYDGEMVAGEAGLYKLQHYLGSPEEPDAYAIFTYDLSQFNGKKVVLMLGVYNVVGDTSENKLSIYSITLE
jgi:hypothetical protein